MDVVRFAYLHEPPFCYTEKDGSVDGSDIRLARKLACDIGLKLSFIETEFRELIPGLCDGRWSMTTGLFITAERERRMLFSRPIWALPDGLMVRQQDAGNIVSYASIAQSKSTILAVVADQIQHQTALAQGIPQHRIKIFATQAEAATAVFNGLADAYASVAMAHQGYIDCNPDQRLIVKVVSAEEKEPASGAFGISKTRPDLKIAIDNALMKHSETNW